MFFPKKKSHFFSMISFLRKRFSFPCLVGSQFLGALNDNIYKLLTIFLLISSLGVAKSSVILSSVGALYVIPFLLFSSAAGILADRLSKQKLILGLKGFEVVIMALSILAFSYKSVWGSYSLLFLLATHSAFFGPSKYSIIPELVEKKEVAKANSHITAFTYLAIIIGTFLASFLSDITQGNYAFSVAFCLLFAICGFLSSLGIKETEAQKSKQKINLFFLKEIFQTILDCRKTPLLVPCLFGSAYFLFIGAFTQLNIIPFAIESLHLSEYAGGYLFLFTAIGITLGSALAAKLLKKKVELGISCLAGFIISFLFAFIWLFSSFLTPTLIFLTLIGVVGGVFIISFDTFIQLSSPIQTRGQIIATGNFLSFFGVLVASAFLYVFGYLLSFSPALNFFSMGIITFFVTIVLTARLLEVSLPFFSRLLGAPLEDEKQQEYFHEADVIILEEFNWKLLIKVSFSRPRCHLLFRKKTGKKIPFFFRLAPNVMFIPEQTSLQEGIYEAKKHVLTEEHKVYFFFQEQIPLEALEEKKGLFSFQKSRVCTVSLSKKNTLLIK